MNKFIKEHESQSQKGRRNCEIDDISELSSQARLKKFFLIFENKRM